MAASTEMRGRLTLLFLLLIGFGQALAEDVAPADTDISAYINNGHYDFSLGGNALWNSQVFINNAAKANLTINGNFNSVALRAGGISLLRDFSVDNTVTITNTFFRPSNTNTANNDYLIGIGTNNVTTNLTLSGTVFEGFNRTANRGATVLYAYAPGATVTVDGGTDGLVFRGNRAEWDAAGAVAVSYANLTFNGNVTFDSNWTGNYGGAVVVYDYQNRLTFAGNTTFTGNHASVFGGAIDVWGGAATVVFEGESTFDGNYVYFTQGNSFEQPRHVTDQHARGGAINIGYIASTGSGASVTFDAPVTFSNNYVVSTGANANNRNALGGAVSVYGNNSSQDYRLVFNKAATFQGNYVYATNAQGTASGGAIYYDSRAAQLTISSGSSFSDNYAKTYGGAIYLQAGTINLNADTADITFSGNRHGAEFGVAPDYRPITGSGTPNAIYLGSGGTLNLQAGNGQTIHFHDPIASIAGSQVVVNKTGPGEVVFYSDNGLTTLFNSTIQANTNVQGGLFTLADGVEYGSADYGVFTVDDTATVRGGGGGALNAGALVIQSGGALGASGGVFTVNAGTATLQQDAKLIGFGTLASTTNLTMNGTVNPDIAAGDSLTVTARLVGSGGLDKTGDGTLTLAAANTYAGATTVNAGILAGGTEDAFAASSSVTVNAGGTLDTNGFSQTAMNLSGSGALRLTDADLVAVMSSDREFSGVISGTGGLGVRGGSTLTISGDNSYAGTTSITEDSTIVATRGTSLGSGLVLGLVGSTLELRYDTEEVFANRLAGNATVLKTGDGTARVTGSGSYVDQMTVEAGELSLEQQGVFWAERYTTTTNATTSIASGSKLYAAESFSQKANSTLNVQIGNNEPAITAISASIDGTLNVTGFTSGPLASASQVDDVEYTIIRTSKGITGNFDVTAVDNAGVTADYLTIRGEVTNSRLDYTIGLDLRWNATADALGTFTLTDADDAFDVDVVLADRGQTFLNGWNGNSLTKAGLGTLTLSAQNTYSGATDIRDGTLAAGAANVLDNSSDTTVQTGATLDLNGFDQLVNNLSGGGSVILDGAELTAVYNQNESFTGNLSGGGTFIKDGASDLTLSGTNSHTATIVRQGGLVAASASALGEGTVAMETNGRVDLALASAGTVDNQFSGAGTLRNLGLGTATLTGAGSNVGSVNVASGELAFSQNGLFTAGSYRTVNGATTSIGETARLDIGGAFVQEGGSFLNVAIGQNNEPAITADSAQLAGTLTITGFNADMFRAASRFADNSYDVVQTTQEMTTGFDVVDIGTIINPVDYLTVDGFFNANHTVYSVGFKLTWYTGATNAHGTFTIADGETFNVDGDIRLENQTGSFDSGWSGKDLTKAGNGTLILSSVPKTYTGSTTVEAGILATAVNDAFAASTSVDVQSGGTLALQNTTQTAQNLEGDGAVQLGGGRLNVLSTSATEFGGVISGAGSVDKSGNADFTLSGDNTYENGTSVTQGRLIAASATALGSGTATVADNASLRLDIAGGGTVANTLSGTGRLEKAGAATVRLTGTGSSIGEVNVSGGNLTLAQTGVMTAGEYTTRSNATTALESGSQLRVNGQFTQESAATLEVAVGMANNPAIQAGSARLGGTLNVTGFDAEAFTRSSAIPTDLYTVVSSDTAITGLFTSETIDSTAPVDYLTLAGFFSEDRKQYYVGLDLTWNASTDRANGTFDVADAFVVDTVLRDRSGETFDSSWDGHSLTKNGSGTLTLAAVNTYEGSTTVDAGTLVLATDNTIKTSSAVTVVTGATLRLKGTAQTANNLSGGGTVALGGTNLTSAYSGADKTFSGQMSGTGRFVKSGTGQLTLSGGNTYSGGTTVSDGRLVAIHYDALGTGAVTIDNPGILELALDASDALDNALSGGGQVLKTGTGTTFLTAAGSSVGAVDVQAGSLALAQTGAFFATGYTIGANAATSISGDSRLDVSTGSFTMSDSTSALSVTVGPNNQPAITANAATLNGTLNVTGFRTEDGLARASALIGFENRYEVVRSNSTITGNFTQVNIGTAASPADYLTLEGTVIDNSYFITFGLTWEASEARAHGEFNLVNEDERFVVDTVLANRSGSFTSSWDGKTLTKNGDGTLVLAASNTYGGSTLIRGGTLETGVENAFADSTRVTLDNGATLDMNGYSQTVQNLSGEGNISLGDGNATLTLAASQSGNDYFGVISGNGKLIKTGSDALTLSGRNTYTGRTVVEAGTLILTNGGALSRGNVEVSDGSKLTLNFTGDETFTNKLTSSNGTITKSGSGIARLTGEGSSVGVVEVTNGELSFELNGEFTAAQITTADSATISIGPQSQLTITGELRQSGANSVLNVTTGTDNNPVIQADTAQLDGILNISGFSSQTYEKASELPESAFTIIKTTGGINGDFDRVVIGNVIDPLDYLAVKGGISSDSKNYEVGVQLAWNAGNNDATGTFTISGTDTFEVDEALVNQTNVPGTNPWNGQDLTKKGTGTLILSSSANSFTGSTDIQAGTLRTGADNVFDDSSSVKVAAGAVLNTGKADGQSWYDQTAKQLTGDGSIILGGNNTLTVGSTDPPVPDSVFSGTISGDGMLRKVGTTSTLRLSGENSYTGGTEIVGGTLILQRGNSAGTGSISTNSGSTLQLDIAASQTETFDNSLSGDGSLNKTGDGTAELTGGGIIGNVNVQGGTLALRQDGVLQAAGYEAQTGTTTDIGAQSQLNVSGTYTQENNSTLHVAIGSVNEPAIKAGDATLAGNLVITGFDTSTFSSASSILNRNFVVVKSGSPLSTGFTSTTIESAGVTVDFLTITGQINPDLDNEYIVGFDLKWNATDGTAIGDFTLAEGEVFDVDRVLNNNDNIIDPSWDGTTLTKKGDGTLILSAQNGYAGNTNIEAGTLKMGTTNAIQESSGVNVAGGASFDLNGFDQSIKSIAGDGSILLGDRTLSVGLISGATSSTFGGTISGSGSLTINENHTLTLSGASDYSGGTTIVNGTLVLQNGLAAGTGDISAATGTSLQLDVDTTQAFANTLTGTGRVEKTGGGTAILTGEDSNVGDVNVQEGSITLAQNGEFTAQNYEIQSGAGTSIGSGANLVVEDDFTKGADASLTVAIGTEPTIKAESATVGGNLSIGGFGGSTGATKASELMASRHVVLQTTGPRGITGNFTSVDFGGQLADAEYLVLNGSLNNTRDQYTVGFDLAWNAGAAEGTGTFTIAVGNDFEVDVVLEDKDDNGPFASGWNGRDLTKEGDGTLILSSQNTYSGATTVNGGTLQVTANSALGNTDSLTVANGATFDLTDTSQAVGFLNAQTGSVLDLGQGALVVDSSKAPGGRRDNTIDGTVQGSGVINLLDADLTVTGDNAGYQGDVNASYLPLAATGSTITLENVHGLGDSGTITFGRSDDSLVFAGAAQTGTFSKQVQGDGTVSLEDGTDITLSGDNSDYSGNFTVDVGATMRAGAAENLGTAGVQVGGTLHLSSAAGDNWQLDNAVTGTGDFVKDGDGVLNIGSSMDQFDGTTRVAAGTLVVGDDTDTGAVLASPVVEVDAGGSLSGTGTVGEVHNRGVIASLNSVAGYETAAPSNLHTGRLVNEGRIRLAGTAVGNTLTVSGGMESQNGILEINTVLGDDSSLTDKLILDGGVTTGTTGVVVHNRGGAGAQTDVGIMIVEARNDATTTNDSFALSSSARNFRIGAGTIAAGAYDYSLLRGGNGGAENSWYLVSEENARPEAGNYLVNRDAAESLVFHTMYDRMLGYQEYADPATGERRLDRAWAHVQYARSTQNSVLPGMNGVTRTFVAQTGLDLWRAESGLGVFSAGAMIGFGTASGKIHADFTPLPAKANLNGYVAGGYATWFMDRQRADGLYVDAWVQHAWFRNRTSGAGLPGEHFNSRLWSGSLEAGYAFPLYRTATAAWSVVPTFQVTYNGYTAKDFVEATGTAISFTDRDRFLTRTGFRVKGRIAAPGRLPSEPYFEFNWLYQGKRHGITMDQDRVSLRSPQNLYEAKLGIEAEVLKNLRVGLGVSGQFGKNNYRRLAGQVGIRLDW
ncbi:MAG: autotransporter-associated beta strand repeat-containing protein [Planctomycetaceae bacterium]|nr:autotransporter-associated beta strand repeat-containing protein [Planctomycetaceae bacterium]